MDKNEPESIFDRKICRPQPLRSLRALLWKSLHFSSQCFGTWNAISTFSSLCSCAFVWD